MSKRDGLFNPLSFTSSFTSRLLLLYSTSPVNSVSFTSSFSF
jgi:hypothetical protein